MILCKIIYKISRFLKFNESSHIIFLKVSNYKCIRFKLGKKSSRHDSKCEPDRVIRELAFYMHIGLQKLPTHIPSDSPQTFERHQEL